MNDEMRNTLQQAIEDVGLAHRADLIMRLASPSVRLIAEPTDEDSIPVGASKIGGRPDLPEGMDWPLAGDADSRPLYGETPSPVAPISFVAQINLAETSAIDVSQVLPREGMLYVFLGLAQGAWRLIHHPDGALFRRPIPAAVPQPERYSSYRLTPQSEITLPIHGIHGSYGGEEEQFLDVYDTAATRVTLTAVESDAYDALYRKMIGAHGREFHRMLGHAQYVQNPVKLDLEMGVQGIKSTYETFDTLCDAENPFTQELKAQTEASHWTLLLQIDTIHAAQPEFMWEDGGRLSFFLREADIRNANFTKAILDAQSH